MITAKNYAAQAEYGLQWFIAYLRYCECYDDARQVENTRKTISKAVKFVIPDDGRLFDDDLKGLKGNMINLPFPVITVEFYQNNRNGGEGKIIDEGHTIERMSKIVLLAIDVDDSENPVIGNNGEAIKDSIMVHMIKFYDSDKNWQLHEISLIIKKDAFLAGDNFYFSSLIPKYLEGCQQKFYVDEEQLKNDCLPYYKAFFELLEALSCANVEPAIHQDACSKNDKRIKQGKLPIYETKVLTIKANKSELANGTGIKGSHASPRQHLRRGHIRRLPTGNIWVNSCVVGSKENGVINKSYRVIP